MAAPRQPHPGNVSWAERERPVDRHPPRLLLFDPASLRKEEDIP